ERPTIGAYLQIGRKVDAGRVDLLSLPRFSTARDKVEREIKRAQDEDDERFAEITRAASGGPPVARSDEVILCEDFLKWAPAYRGERFNFLHFDLPYGIDADGFNQGSAPAHGGYADTPETYRELCNCFITHLDRFCTDSAHIVFWFSMENYEWTF